MWTGAPGGGPLVPARTAGSPAHAGMARRRMLETADDPSWLLVSALSADVSVEEAEASGAWPPPGGADKALLQLDDAERMELARILRAESTRRPARRRALAPAHRGQRASAEGQQIMRTREHRTRAFVIAVLAAAWTCAAVGAAAQDPQPPPAGTARVRPEPRQGQGRGSADRPPGNRGIAAAV